MIGRLGLPTQTAAASASFELPYYLAIAAAQRLERIFSIGWLGSSMNLRLPLAFALAFLALGARVVPGKVPTWRGPAALGALLAVIASIVATPGAEGTWLRFQIWGLGMAGVVWLSAGLAAAPSARMARRAELALAAWAAPPFLAWIAATPYVLRLLSPAWVPLVALASGVVVAAMRGLETRGHRLLAGLGPLALWLGALSSAARREVAYRSFARTLQTVETELGGEGVVISPSGAFRYFFPGRALQIYPRSCGDLASADVFVR